MKFTMIRATIAAAVAGAGVSLGGVAAASPSLEYLCGQDMGYTITIETETGKAEFNGPSRAKLKPDNEGAWVNTQREIQFYPEENPPTLWMGSEQFDCQGSGGYDDAGDDNAGAAEADLNIPGKSYGGRLREGPSMDARSAGSLPEGARITIIYNSGTTFNGYDWFVIETSKGVRAYHWGGIICSKGQYLPGVLQAC
jgi:hypothetical protein